MPSKDADRSANSVNLDQTALLEAIFLYEPRCEKRPCEPGPTQTGLYNHRRWLEARAVIDWSFYISIYR